jgi:N-acetylneuraminic acid mutarotase
LFQFGGGTTDGEFNNLYVLDLSFQHLEFENLSEHLKVPTARKGHDMETYNDKLYIFGGVDSKKNR